LITRGVPSTARVDSIEQSLTLTPVHEDGDDDDDDDWLVSSITPRQQQRNSSEERDMDDIEDDFDILDINEDGEVVVEEQAKKKGDDVEPAAPATAAAVPTTGVSVEDYPEDEEYADMADFEDDDILVDDQDVTTSGTPATTTSTSPSSTVPTRRYDISITYDKYYQTPRVWMTGFNEKQQPLSVEELMEDVVTDYRHKTVTMEPHPHSTGRQASIHPCQHSKVMKVIVHNLIKASSGSSSSASGNDEKNNAGEDDDTVPAVDVTQYLFIFLKFVSSIIPTVNYDFTMNVEASTSKD
jgi:ubiquitin-like-conjugating enzyme ATG3